MFEVSLKLLHADEYLVATLRLRHLSAMTGKNHDFHILYAGHVNATLDKWLSSA